MKCPIRVPEDFQMHWCVACILPVRFDAGAGFGSLDHHVVGHRAMRSLLSARRQRCTTGKKDRSSETCSVNQGPIHLATYSLRIGNFTTSPVVASKMRM